jgi:hypothetical protein
MWIIVVFIVALGGGMMTYRAATGYRTEPAAPSAAKTQAKLFPLTRSIPAVRSSAGSTPGHGADGRSAQRG